MGEAGAGQAPGGAPAEGARESRVPSVAESRVSSSADSEISISEFLNNPDENPDNGQYPLAYQRDYDTVPEDLRNMGPVPYNFNLSIVSDDEHIIQPAKELLKTMDSQSRAFVMLSPDSQHHMVNPVEGASFDFISLCDGVCIPPHLENVLYFFHRLKEFLKSNPLTQFVVPAPNIMVVYPRTERKDIRGLREVQDVDVDTEHSAGDGRTGAFSLQRVLQQRRNMAGTTNKTVDVQPFKINLSFTGVLVRAGDEGGRLSQELIARVTIRTVRTFDLQLYIEERFLAKKHSMTDERQRDIGELEAIYRKILQYEANTNCGLTEDPFLFLGGDSYGEVGVHTLTHMLTTPLRIYKLIEGAHRDLRSLKIVGCPNLSFRDDEEMKSYSRYLHETLNHNARIQAELRSALDTYYKSKPADRLGQEYKLPCPGGWPERVQTDSARGSQEIFTAFSFFQWPIEMALLFVKEPPLNASFTTFKNNLGELPTLATTRMRYFTTVDLQNPSSMMDDARLLQGAELATPQRRTERYCGDHVNPVEELITEGAMLGWYKALRDHIDETRSAGGITVDSVVDLLKKHMATCMKHHEGLMKSKRYHSDYLEACYSVACRISKVTLNSISLNECLRRIRMTQVEPEIRHDPYLSVCRVFYILLVEMNNHIALNPANLECLLEMWITSIHYIIGSHDPSFTNFFQGIVVASARGHLQVHTPTGDVSMDVRKPNTTGAGFVYTVVCKTIDWMADEMRLSSSEAARLHWFQEQRSTGVAMEAMCSYTVMGSDVVEEPPRELYDRPHVLLEGGRHADQEKGIIMSLYRDDKSKNNVRKTTMDPKKTNVREVGAKYTTTQAYLCGLSTNCKPANALAAEQWQSITAVTHVLAPGAPRYVKQRTEENVHPNKITCDVNDTRARKPENTKQYKEMIKLLIFTQHWVKVAL